MSEKFYRRWPFHDNYIEVTMSCIDLSLFYVMSTSISLPQNHTIVNVVSFLILS